MTKSSSRVFRTHSNYISAISYVALDGNLSDEAEGLKLLSSKLMDSGWYMFLKPDKADRSQLHRSINNAWGLEALYKMSDVFISEDDLTRLSNNWCVVQCYYIFYYLTQVIAICEGYKKPLSHAQVQRTYYSIMSKKPWFISPWSLWYDQKGSQNTPPGFRPDNSIHAWRRVDDSTSLNLVLKALRTTREEYVNEAITRRKERLSGENAGKTIRLSQKQKNQSEARVRPATLISYLYRIKRNTLYERSSMLSTGPENFTQSKQFRWHVRRIIDTTLLIAEMLVSETIGEELFNKWCSELEHYKPPAFIHTGPTYRMELIRGR